MAMVPSTLIKYLTNVIPGYDREIKKFEV